MNDVMLTGRTRALGLIGVHVNAAEAERAYAAATGRSTDQLTEAGKLEAVRTGVLKALGAQQELLGTQTDSLDEKVAQASATWGNFTNDLGKTMATSHTLSVALDGVSKMLVDAFGGDRKTLIAAISSAVDDVTVHMIDFGKPVNVFGMQAAHDDVIHADYHGAVVVPGEAVKKLPAAIDHVARREKVILDICRAKDFSPAKLRDAIKRAGEIH